MTKQITDIIMMIRPVAFRMNKQTTVNNYYQQELSGMTADQIQQKAMAEFDAFVAVLRSSGIYVIVFDDTPYPSTPDSIFPNNWISFHEDGMIRLYPMFAENRRQEHRDDIIAAWKEDFEVTDIQSFVAWEARNSFLEGTGSLLLDRQNKIVYATLSDRTMTNVLEDFCARTGYKPVTFHANQTVNGERLPIYHTNVMMCLGEHFAVVCMDSVDDDGEKAVLAESLSQTGKELLEISEMQKEHFAGNMLQVMNKDDNRLIVMSSSAYYSLDEGQIKRLETNGQIVHVDIRTIETLGGGSVRCMMAEVFLQKKENN